MHNHKVLSEHWHEVQGLLKERWSQLVDEDLQAFKADIEQLVAAIQHKTGETKEAVEQYLHELAERSFESLDLAQGQAADVAEQMAEGVRQRPGQALAVAFGAGLLAGAGVALLLRSRAREVVWEQSHATRQQLGGQLRKILEDILHKAGDQSDRG